MDIASLIKLARTSLNLSINALAKITSISNSTISSYENGITEPDIVNTVKLAEALQLPLHELDIMEDDFNVKIEDISYIKRYSKNHQVYYRGHCECNKEVFVKEEDLSNPLRTKCKGCTVKKLQSECELDIDSADLEKLNNLYQERIVIRSRQLGLPCEISLFEYIKMISKNCEYCGQIPNQTTMINNKVFRHNGVDRINSNYGYVKNNVVPCCSVCNMMKGSLSGEEFLIQVDRIYKYKG